MLDVQIDSSFLTLRLRRFEVDPECTAGSRSKYLKLDNFMGTYVHYHLQATVDKKVPSSVKLEKYDPTAER